MIPPRIDDGRIQQCRSTKRRCWTLSQSSGGPYFGTCSGYLTTRVAPVMGHRVRVNWNLQWFMFLDHGWAHYHSMTGHTAEGVGYAPFLPASLARFRGLHRG